MNAIECTKKNSTVQCWLRYLYNPQTNRTPGSALLNFTGVTFSRSFWIFTSTPHGTPLPQGWIFVHHAADCLRVTGNLRLFQVSSWQPTEWVNLRWPLGNKSADKSANFHHNWHLYQTSKRPKNNNCYAPRTNHLHLCGRSAKYHLVLSPLIHWWMSDMIERIHKPNKCEGLRNSTLP